jgi:uncharacterized protein (TIGR00106 family)
MLAEFSVAPVDRASGMSGPVAEILNLVEESGLDYLVNPMGTVVEGPCDQVFDLIRRCHLRMRDFSPRVATVVKIDDRDGAEGAIRSKLQAVEEKLGKELP